MDALEREEGLSLSKKGCLTGEDPIVMAVVEDTGIGIPQELIPTMFEPFFTTKPTGTGLGLAVTKTIVDLHKGIIDLANRDPGGVRVILVLKNGGIDNGNNKEASPIDRRRTQLHARAQDEP